MADENVQAHIADTTSLKRLGEQIIARHAEAREHSPKQGATAYLRQGLSCARAMAQLARADASLWSCALDLTAQIIQMATVAEEEIFAAGGNSAAYLGVLIAAHTLRVKLAIAAHAAITHDATRATKEAVPTRPATFPQRTLQTGARFTAKHLKKYGGLPLS